MKQFIVFFAAFLVLAACNKTNEHLVIKGKLVYRSCAR